MERPKFGKSSFVLPVSIIVIVIVSLLASIYLYLVLKDWRLEKMRYYRELATQSAETGIELTLWKLSHNYFGELNFVETLNQNMPHPLVVEVEVELPDTFINSPWNFGNFDKFNSRSNLNEISLYVPLIKVWQREVSSADSLVTSWGESRVLPLFPNIVSLRDTTFIAWAYKSDFSTLTLEMLYASDGSVKWQRSIGGVEYFSSPVCVGETLVIVYKTGGEVRVKKINLSNGSDVWDISTFLYGIGNEAVYDEGFVYVLVSQRDISGETGGDSTRLYLLKINLSTGNLDWNVEISTESGSYDTLGSYLVFDGTLPSFGNPVIVGNTVYSIFSENYWISSTDLRRRVTIVANDKVSGNELWRVQLPYSIAFSPPPDQWWSYFYNKTSIVSDGEKLFALYKTQTPDSQFINLCILDLSGSIDTILRFFVGDYSLVDSMDIEGDEVSVDDQNIYFTFTLKDYANQKKYKNLVVIRKSNYDIIFQKTYEIDWNNSGENKENLRVTVSRNLLIVPIKFDNFLKLHIHQVPDVEYLQEIFIDSCYIANFSPSCGNGLIAISSFNGSSEKFYVISPRIKIVSRGIYSKVQIIKTKIFKGFK